MGQRILRLIVDLDTASPCIERPVQSEEIVVLREPTPECIGKQVKSLADYRNPDKDFLTILEEAHQLLYDWDRITNHDGRPLAELATYQRISLWRASEINLLFWLVPFIDVLSVFERIFDVERPRSVEIVGTDRVAAAAAIALADARGVPAQWNLAGHRHSFGQVHATLGRWPVHLSETFLPLARRIRPPAMRVIGRLWNRWVDARSPRVGKRRILALTVNRRFANILLPVFDKLAANRENALLIVDKGFSSATPLLSNAGFNVRAFSGYETRTIARRVSEVRRQLMRQWMTLRQDPVFRDGWRCRNVNCWIAVEPKLQEYFTRLFPQLVRTIETTWELVRRESPQAVVLVDERPPFQRAFVEATKATGVPTVNIQNAVYANIPYGSPIATDYVLVDGELFRDNLVARGTDLGRIVVTGQPRFDFLVRKDARFDRLSICRHLSLDPTIRIVLLASHPVSTFDPAEERRALLHAICVAVKAIPQCALVIKLHPDEVDDRFHRETAASVGLDVVRIVRDMDAWELLYASDVVVVASSTMGYEAIVMDRPLIQFIYHAHGRELYPYVESGAALGVATLKELEPALLRALEDHDTRQALQQGRAHAVRRFAYRLDGQASGRAARFIEQVAEADLATPASFSATGVKR